MAGLAGICRNPCRTAIALFLVVALGAAEASAQQGRGLAVAASVENALVEAIGQAERSVVAIARVRKEQPGEVHSLEFRPDPFGRRSPVVGQPQPTDPDFIPNEYATGVVVDRRGLILTTYHALGQQSEYYVTTADRKVYRATIRGADPRSDLAVLAIDATDLTPITLGDASTLRKGRIVVALGNPYAIARDGQVSAAWGIVANLARKAPPTPGDFESAGKTTLHHFGTLIQTDAKLNLGTSGGPLLDLQGRMVGLVTALPPADGVDVSAGYAIPVDATFRRIVDALKQGREVQYGFLGVQPANLTSREVLAGMQGMRVLRVQPGPGTPAVRGGLQAGDVVTAVNGRPIHDADGLMLEVGRLPVETIARLSVIRDGRPMELRVPLGKYPVRGEQIITSRPDPWRGLRVDYPTALVAPEHRRPGGVSYFEDAVLVVDVQRDSPAWTAGIRPGMYVSHVDSYPVNTPREFRARVAGRSGPVRLRLTEDERPLRTIAPGS
ncbi:MAG: trypsin-like peptidase domain-containing protein [Pirellulales bacterium]|nr:trypsin-like peptidase domain-containing protein [Pirellulales bacterium]